MRDVIAADRMPRLIVLVFGAVPTLLAFHVAPQLMAHSLIPRAPSSTRHHRRAPLRFCEPNELRPSLNARWRGVAAAAAGGALVATAVNGVGYARTSALLVLRAGLFVAPFVSAARLYRDNRRRAALVVALSAAARRFCTRPWQYLTIPLVAGAVGWITNYIAVEMIFEPREYLGLRLRTWPNNPAGLFCWQGIVPCKARVMAQRLCDLVTGKLLDVRQVFKRLDPDRVAELLTPGVDRIAEQVVAEMVPSGAGAAATAVGRAALRGLPASAQEELSALRHEYVAGLTRDMQRHVKELLDVDEVVVGGMVREKQLLVELFRRCGRVELDFLVHSGFGFGCLLGVVQMCLWIFYELPWTLAAGGAVVGYLTNWIALLLIFAPVEPRRFGPFVLQGLFLKRQHEVSEEFADCMTEKLLASETLWHNILTGRGSTRFAELLHERTAKFMAAAAAVLYGGAQPTEFATAEWWGRLERRVSGRTLELLPTQLPLIHGYVDEQLQLRETLKTNLRRLTPQEFEQVLHPVFQEDEFTLILVGAVLGLAVGWGQAAADARSKRKAEQGS